MRAGSPPSWRRRTGNGPKRATRQDGLSGGEAEEAENDLLSVGGSDPLKEGKGWRLADILLLVFLLLMAVISAVILIKHL